MVVTQVSGSPISLYANQYGYHLDTRNRIAAVFIYRKRPLEALNFCLSSLDRSSIACSSHTNYNPLIALEGVA